jgi:tRNA-dihydrouridine synthase A
MMDWTDRHCRYFLRGFSPRVRLYTEMITAAAIVRGDRVRLLRFSPEEHPLALQLGGSEPAMLAAAARAALEFGYDEINLNCGCPSERVRSGAFGACLMREPALVAECVGAMRAAVSVPVTVKIRVGLVEHRGERGQMLEFSERDYDELCAFTAMIVAAGCDTVIVHARKAVLSGLSPRENREVPPLRLDVVERLKREFARVRMVLNGGLRTPAQCLEALAWCDGVMLGREAYHRPFLLAELHALLFQDGWRCPEAPAQLERMAQYAERELALGEPLAGITRHVLGLCAGRPGARRFRQLLADGARVRGQGAALLREAAKLAA